MQYKHTTLARARLNVSKSGEPIITGYASVFGNIDSAGDIVQSGAYAATLKDDGPTFVTLWQHNTDEPIGTGTFREDDYGLLGEYRFVPGVRRADEAVALIKAAVISGISVGYGVPPGGSTYRGGNRILTTITLYETSFVTMPANDLARVTDGAAALKTLRALQDVIASHTSAQSVASWFAEVRRNTGRSR